MPSHHYEVRYPGAKKPLWLPTLAGLPVPLPEGTRVWLVRVGPAPLRREVRERCTIRDGRVHCPPVRRKRPRRRKWWREV